MSVPRIEPVTPDLTQENIEKILELFPNVATEVQDPETGEIRKAVDFDALRNQLGDVAEGMRERYRFTWPGKRAARDEAFRPIAKTLRPVKERSKNWDDTQNLYIEGDNLDALKILRETYAGKIKLIYIDPPYNTGHDFIYDDDYSLNDKVYQKGNGEHSEQGQLVANPESNGRFHSDWCSMIYARLMLARDLLSADGLLFVSIDDHEEENLRKICDEIFGEESFAACAPRKTGAGSAATRSASELRKMNDFVLIYRKTPNAAFRKLIVGEKEYPYTDQWGDFKLAQFQASGSDATRAARPNMYYPLFISNDARIELEQSPYGDLREILPEKVNGEDGRWLWRPEKVTQDKEHYLTVKDGHVFRKIYYNPNEDQTLYQVEKAWFDNYRNADGTKELAALLEEKQLFSNPKPVGLIKKLISMHPDNNALVLDFFSGSGTTAQAIMEQNKEDGGERRFILVQYPEPVDSGTRTYNLGYHNICEIGEERIRRAGERIKSEVEQENQQLKLDSEPQRVPDIGFRVLRVDSSNYKDVHRTPAETTQGALDEFVDVSKTDRESLDKLFECFPTFQLPYDSSIEVLSGPAFANHTVYSVNGGQLVACFDAEIPESVLRGMAALDPKPSYAVVAQAGLKNSQTVTNFEEIFKQSANAQQGSTQTRII